jgi:leucyl/phenylalanyl-tRNA--protein transferase
VRAVRLIQRAHGRFPRLVRVLLGTFYYSLKPRRLVGIPGVAYLLLRRALGLDRPDREFPPAERALRRPEGMLVAGGTLDADRLLAAYRRGLYPWCHVGPTKWWCPAQRMVLFLDETRVSRRLRGYLRSPDYRVTFDTAFREVMRACAEPRPDRLPLSWITPRMQQAYGALHDLGHAHSVEVWVGGELAGGLYGVAIGGVFFTESMFARRSQTSRIALTVLNCSLQAWGFSVNDVKRHSAFWSDQGARLVPRDEFLALVERLRDRPVPPAPWRVDGRLAFDRWQPAEGPVSARTEEAAR